MPQTQRFDQAAPTWDENPRRVRMTKAIAETIAQNVPLSGAQAVLDFGCGTGLLTLKLRPSVGSITGVDTSPGMLEVLRRKVLDQGLEGVEAILLSEGGEIQGVYDLIVSSMALHHVPDLPGLLRQFREHLRPGGYIALADLDREDGTFHSDAKDVFHLGFERGELKALLAEAGFAELEDRTAFEFRRNSRDYPVFLVTGR